MPSKKIVAFCCENSAIKAAEALQDAKLLKGVEIVSLACTGQVEIDVMLDLVADGVEAVLVLACPLDNCKYIRGNKRARQRVTAVRKALADTGADPESVRIEFLSSVDTHKLMAFIKEAQSA